MAASEKCLLGQLVQLPPTNPWAAVAAPAVKLYPAAL
jgi:hypothetical protein